MSDLGPAIAANELTKRYGPENGEATVLAVDRVSFQVRPGEFFGFLGPNGAGKTTTIRMLTGLTKPTSGTMTIAGLEVADHLVEVKERIGVVSDVANLYAELSAGDNLDFVAKLQGMPRRRRAGRAEDLLRFLGLYQCRDRPVGTFSTGQRKRLMIAAALIHEPQILFLDEPTTGLDVRSARRIRELLSELNERGVTIFLTTHYIEEADQLCGRIAIINQGRIVTVDTPEALKSRIQRKKVIEVSFDCIVDGISRRLRGLYLLHNVRKPLNVALISDQIENQVMASGLSVESQLVTLLVAIIAPILGALADFIGVGGALVVLGLGMAVLAIPARVTISDVVEAPQVRG